MLKRYLSVGAGAAVMLGIYLGSLHNYLLVHSVVEIATIAIALALFMLVWNTRAYSDNSCLRLLGIGYAFSALIDLVHALAYKGMNVFPGYDANLPTQLWLAARYLQTATLVAAPLVLGRRLNERAVVAAYAAAVTVLGAAVFSGYFPDCYVEGKGLTNFKIGSEYLLSALLLGTLYLFVLKREHFDDKIFGLVAASIVCTALSEISFTAYVSVYGFSNLVGHGFKLAAFLFIYRAILVTGIKAPFDLIFRELKQAELGLRRAQDSLEDKVRERTAELRASEERYSSLIRKVPAAIVVHDGRGRLLYSNPVAQEMLGLPSDQLLGKTLGDLDWQFAREDGTDLPVAEYPVALVLSSRAPLRDYIFGIKRPDRHDVVWVLVNAEPEADDAGAIARVIVSFFDISRRKRAETELEEQERHSQSLLRLSRNLEKSSSYAQVLDAARDEVRSILGYQSLWAYLLTDDKKYAHALVAGGPATDAVMSEPDISTLAVEGDPMMEEIAAAREIVVVADARTDPRTNKEIVARIGNRTIVNVPIILFDRHLGTVGTGTFGEEGVRVPTGSEQDYLMALASHMAVTLNRIHLSGERGRAEEALHRQNRELRAISNCNQILVRAENEQTLLDAICSTICDQAGYRMAWVGYVEHDDAKTVHPAAWAGFDNGYIADAQLTWSVESERGSGPAGKVVRSGEPICVKDFATDPQVALWRDSALQRGYRSCIALPLKDEGANTFGILSIYSSEADAFNSDEIRLLEELAGDLAFGITVLRARDRRKQAERELTLVNFAMNHVREAAFLIDKDARFAYVNDDACQVLEYSREELLGLSVADVDPDFPPERWQEHWQALQTRKDSHRFEGRHRTKSGRIFPVEIAANYFEYEGQGYNLALVRDVTERKCVEDALVLVAQRGWQPGEESFFDVLAQFLCEKLDMDYALIDRMDEDPDIAETVALYAKGAITPNMRYALKGTPCENVMARRLCVYRHGVQQLFPEDTLLREMCVECYVGIPLWDSTGRPIGLIAVMGNKPLIDDAPVTQLLQLVATRAAAEMERERSDRLLRAREHEFRTLAENLPDNIVRYDREGRTIYVNPVLERTLGFDAACMLGTRVRELYPDGSYEAYAQAVDAALASGENGEIELTVPVPSKEPIVHQIRMIAERDKHGEVTGVLAIGRDITERKRTEAQLKLAASVFEHAHEGVTITDADGNIIAVNRRFTEVTGYSSEEVIGRNPRILKSGRHDADFYRAMWGAIAANGFWEGEIWNKRKDGSIYPEWLSISSVRDEQGKATNYVAVFSDISARVAAEAALRESAWRLRFALKAARMLAWEHDLRLDKTIWGEDPESALGPEPEGGYPNAVEMVHPDDRAAFLQAAQEALAHGTPYDTESRFVRTDGAVVWVRAQGMPFGGDATVRPDRFIGVSQDITERRRIEDELRRLNEDLESKVAERTRALEIANRELEAFSYSVSHDLRSPLRAVLGYSRALQEDYAGRLDANAREYLRRIDAGAGKMTQLIEDLLMLSRVSRQEVRMELVDLSALAREVVAEMQVHESGGRTDWSIAPALEAKCDRGLLQVVLYNLLDNARKYSSKRQDARVEFGRVEEDGRMVYFVRDNGAGFDMAYASKLFGAYQRLHSADEFPGTGIGLATVARIIQRHGGEIWAEGRPGAGASFYFTL